LLVGACALLSVGYMVPSLIGVVRHGDAASRIVGVNVFLGWTFIGWIWAFVMACRAPQPRRPLRPASPEWTPWLPGRPEAVKHVGGSRTYVDGTYLVSECGVARTWAICRDGRWGIAYELDDIQRTGAWVDSSDIPIGVLAHALEPSQGYA
jgi:hypothetical protein